MSDFTGPTHSIVTQTATMDGLSFVQEILLNLTELKYCKLGYTPYQGWSLQLFVDGVLVVRDVDYTANGRTIEFVTPLMAQNAKIVALYVTTGVVTAPTEPTIEFDVESMTVRVSAAGVLQILNPADGLWHNINPATHPIDGSLIFAVDQNPV